MFLERTQLASTETGLRRSPPSAVKEFISLAEQNEGRLPYLMIEPQANHSTSIQCEVAPSKTPFLANAHSASGAGQA